MDSQAKDLVTLANLKKRCQELLAQGKLPEAETAAREALHLDPKSPLPLELLAEVQEALGDADQAASARAQASELRKAAWRRQVEAEARGQHELLGEAIRNEIP